MIGIDSSFLIDFLQGEMKKLIPSTVEITFHVLLFYKSFFSIMNGKH